MTNKERLTLTLALALSTMLSPITTTNNKLYININ
jgi:hypothetical protein